MKTPFGELQGPAKVLAVCAVIIFVGFGLCGLEWAVAGAMRGGGEELRAALVVLSLIQAVAIVVASLVAFVAIIVLVVRATSGRNS
ncbi:MAG TPA: hypothetical protein VL986_07625 [Terracidiphilus sp.]|nr:hypothetical protein [Terracidiphilus sp.]